MSSEKQCQSGSDWFGKLFIDSNSTTHSENKLKFIPIYIISYIKMLGSSIGFGTELVWFPSF